MPANPSVKAQSYPYQIPPLEYLKESNPNKLDPWEVQEFFRIESLLRSSEVIQLYKKTYSPAEKGHALTDSLYIKYRVVPGWLVLRGYHHSLMREYPRGKDSETQPFRRSGLTDLRTSHKRNSTTPDGGEKSWQYLKSSILSNDPRFIYLRIDASYPTKIIMEALRKRIKQQKNEIEETPDDSEWFRNQYKEPRPGTSFSHIQRRSKTVYKFDVPAWIDYFTCYDLRHFEAKTFGVIARKVYGSSNKRDNAEKAHDRVKELIKYAESNNWPPPANFLNKKLPSIPPL
jgi:hypothetical protein